MATLYAIDPRYDEALKKARRKRPPLADIASLLTAAHEAGDRRATYALGTWHLHGRFVEKNLKKAVALLKDAAASDIGDALYDLAVCYETGAGVRTNKRKAAELYVRAALHGEKQSFYEVARCYYYGIGVQRDRAISSVWRDRAEELGISD